MKVICRKVELNSYFKVYEVGRLSVASGGHGGFVFAPPLCIIGGVLSLPAGEQLFYVGQLCGIIDGDLDPVVADAFIGASGISTARYGQG